MNNIFKGLKYFLGALAFCLTLSIGMTALADTSAKVNVNAKIRANADTSSTVLATAMQNQTLSVISSTTGTDGNTWYYVWVDANQKGYVRSDLVTLDGTVPAAAATTTTSTPKEDTSETAVTSVEAKTAYITTDNVRIRKGASTNHGIVGTAKRGMSVTISGEATGTDSKKWYQIEFSYNGQNLTGFVRSDFITFEAITNEAAVSEITGGETTEAPAEEAGSEEQAPQEEATVEEPVQEEEPAPAQTVVQLMNANTEPYVASGFEPIILTMNDTDYNAYVNGSFYLLYANVNGVEGWYYFDSSLGTYARYPYDVDAVAGKEKGNVGVLPIIILVVIIVGLLVLSAYLYLRLRDFIYEEDEDDDYEEEKPRRQVVHEKTEQPVRQTQRPATNQRPQQPARQPQRAQGQQRPQNQARPGQPRPNAPGQRQNREMQQKKVDHELRRPQQPVKKAVNQGAPAKSFIETGDDGDIEFIDL